MLRRMEVFLIAAIFILITIVILIIYTKQREQEFKSHNTLIQKTIVNGASYAIGLQLLEKQRHVRLFANEYARQLLQLNIYPSDEKTRSDIKARLHQRFPDFFTYTITDNKGRPKLQDIESLVGKVCERDLENYVANISSSQKIIQNNVYIHPQPFQYHYDIMAPLYGSNSESNAGVFFISFYLKEIVDILKTHEVPGQQLLLVRQSDPSLIEVSSEGARDKISREIRLDKSEITTISQNISGTDWRLVNLPNPDYEKQYFKGLWNEVFIILFIVTLSILLLIFVLTKFSGSSKE